MHRQKCANTLDSQPESTQIPREADINYALLNECHAGYLSESLSGQCQADLRGR